MILTILLACILLAQSSRPMPGQSVVWSATDQMRWDLEHAGEIAQRERLATQQRQRAAAAQRRVCLAVGASTEMHLRLLLDYTRGDTVNVLAGREQKLWREQDKKFRACEKQIGVNQ